mmetsp:Transcript_32106/g.103623  ORF Transcript_32106/g.103623 Transcript_32106/m.103623 type:complete len:267 (-) Transcript_32106:30-830(-)
MPSLLLASASSAWIPNSFRRWGRSTQRRRRRTSVWAASWAALAVARATSTASAGSVTTGSRSSTGRGATSRLRARTASAPSGTPLSCSRSAAWKRDTSARKDGRRPRAVLARGTRACTASAPFARAGSSPARHHGAMSRRNAMGRWAQTGLGSRIVYRQTRSRRRRRPPLRLVRWSSPRAGGARRLAASAQAGQTNMGSAPTARAGRWKARSRGATCTTTALCPPQAAASSAGICSALRCPMRDSPAGGSIGRSARFTRCRRCRAG